MGCLWSSNRVRQPDSDKFHSPVSNPTQTHNPNQFPPHHVDQYGHKIDNVTGGRVWSNKWYVARREAEEHAQKRAAYFQKSQEAFSSGMKKEAHELSALGKQEGLEMERCNKIAADEILLPQALDNNDTIDLHGLFVNEAVEATTSFVTAHIARLKRSAEPPRQKSLHIITGAGHHSDAKKGAAVKPAILGLCRQRGWRVLPDENNEGSFTVYL